MSEFGTYEPFAQSKTRFERHYPARIGDSAPREVTERVGEQARLFIAERLEQMAAEYDSPPGERAVVAEQLVAQCDGCLLRTGELMPTKQALELAKQDKVDEQEIERLEQCLWEGQEQVRIQRFREVHSGLVRRKEQVEPSVLCGRTSRHEFVGQLWKLSSSHGLQFQTETLALGDGGNGLRRGFEMHYANVHYLLDWRHLEVEHFEETGRELGMNGPTAKRWAHQQMEMVARGEQGKVLGALKQRHNEMEPEENGAEPPGYERLGRLIKFVEKYYVNIDYDRWKEDGWPIGSSEVESLHKRLPQKRLKLPGACWLEENLAPMCALRTIYLNDGWWDDFWRWEHQRRAQLAA